MDILPAFQVVRPVTLDDALKARATHPNSRMVGGGTDLIVNIRRGIEAPPVLIDMNGIDELRRIECDAGSIRVGASVTLAELAEHPAVRKHFPVVAAAAGSIAGPTHRLMGTVGGNICLDTRCIFYNQSDWWRAANNHCLKTVGTMCHVAPKSKVCFATFSGDLAPAFLVLGGQVDIVGPSGKRTLELSELYTGDGRSYLTLRPGEIVTAVHAKPGPGWRSDYGKVRVRQSIDYPVAGIAVAVKRSGDTLAAVQVAFTGTNPRPVRLAGIEALCGKPLSEDLLIQLDDLVRDQIMAMKTTFTQGMYRRRVANVMAKRMLKALFAQAG
ncbi:MAG: 4-hydroxybenzoyl-CoA reductase subunit beta [Alphaproteobacteria bacterium]